MAIPGVMWVNSKITKPGQLSAETFIKWYEEVHFPDILKTNGMKTAFRYETVDPAADRPFFALYPMKDILFAQTPEFMTVPVQSDLFPGPNHFCFEFADFDLRFYQHVQTFEPKGTKPGPAPLLLSAGVTPAPGTDADFDSWYRDEHLELVSKCTGYRRSTRFKLMHGLLPQLDAEGVQPPVYVALHEFDGEQLPREELLQTGDTERAKRALKGLVKSEAGIFKLMRVFGDEAVWL